MEDKNRILVSVIMPVYNSEKYLRSAIDSVLCQTLKEFELILIDDGSTDNSGKICDDYMYRDQRVVVIHRKNGGICAARNAGIEMARGVYLAFMDNDDFIDSNLLKDNYELAVLNDADWVKFGKTEIIVQGEKIIKIKKTKFHDAIYEHSQLLDSLMKLRTESVMTFVWDSLIKKSIIVSHNLSFDTNFKYGNEDIDFCEVLAGVCEKFVINSKCYYTHYTRLGVSTSSKYSKEALSLALYLLKKSNERYKNYGIDNKENDLNYLIIVTRQLVVSACQKLNASGSSVTWNKKIITLAYIRQSKVLERYVRISDRQFIKYSKKLWIYRFLFVHKRYRTMLILDKYARKLVYKIRMIRS